MKFFRILMMAVLTIGSVSVSAQDTTKLPDKTKKDKMKHVEYCCPMHKNEVSDKPGKCPKCDRAMTLSKKELMKMEVMKTYKCPMHADITSDRPGKCSKCGMDLTKVEKKKIKMYTCTMHPEVTSYKTGKCSKCGMELKEKKFDHTNH